MGAEKRKRQKAAAVAKAAKADAAADAIAPGKATGQPRVAKVLQATPATALTVGSNWKRLLERRPTIAPKTAAQKASPLTDGGAADNLVALDCEMVGVGPSGTRSALARLSIVDHEGRVLIDAFVRPSERITDYRTHITGISAATLEGPKVLRDDVARMRGAELLDGKVVVGHAVQHDFDALMMTHPQSMTRDTALYKPFRPAGKERKTPSLAHLAELWLHQTIRQDGKHDSVEDACIALRLYRLKSRVWEKSLRSEARGSAAFGAVVSGGGDANNEGAAAIPASVPKKRKRQGEQVSIRERKRQRLAAVAQELEAGPRKRRSRQPA